MKIIINDRSYLVRIHIQKTWLVKNLLKFFFLNISFKTLQKTSFHHYHKTISNTACTAFEEFNVKNCQSILMTFHLTKNHQNRHEILFVNLNDDVWCILTGHNNSFLPTRVNWSIKELSVSNKATSRVIINKRAIGSDNEEIMKSVGFCFPIKRCW